MGVVGDPDALAAGLSFRMLCESSGFGFWQIDTQGRTVYLNPAMCAMLELASPSELGSETYHAFFTPESLARMRAEHEKRAAGTPSTYEVELIGRRGGRRNVLISGAPLRDGQGVLLGLIGTFMDITERKRAELLLEASERRLRSLFNTSVDAIGVSQGGFHVMANPAYLRMFGYTSDAELVGQPILGLIAPGERAQIGDRIKQRSAGDNSINHYHTRGLRQNGAEFPLEVHVAGYEEDGVFITVAVLRDISERLLLEEQLREAQKMDALGRLAGGVAHDFNNLLMITMGCADLIAADPEGSERARRNAQLIRSTGERAVTVTRQLLALSRSQLVDPKLIDLQVLVYETGSLLRQLIGSNIELELDNEPHLARVRADPSQLQQVLINLCVNARDAMPEGGRISVATRNLTLHEGDLRLVPGLCPGRYVLLSVRDGGHGMDEAVRQRLFEPFFTTRVAREGAGLGLPAAYGIVKQSGGHISVASSPGAGSVFSVYLPAVDAAPPRPVAAPVLARRGEHGTVLLVDDELAVRELVQKFLESVGYQVLAAEGGAAALRALQSGARVDVVVSDMLMPGMSGAELARELDRAVPGLPILFISGYAHEEGAQVIGSRPNSGFLPKPFSLADLTGKLRGLIGARTHART